METKKYLRNKISELENEIKDLNFRVKELEEKLCPCESHDWKEVDSVPVYGWKHDKYIVYAYDKRLVCSKCGKGRELRKYE